MAYLLGCENVHLEFPTKKVFDSVTLGIDEGDRIGIVGGNGDGKSSLLALLAGSRRARRRPRHAPRRHPHRHARADRRARSGGDRRPRGRRRRARAHVGVGRARSAASCAASSPTSPGTAASASSPAGSGVASTSPACSSATSTCSCSTSPPTTSTSTRIAWLAEHLKQPLAEEVGRAARRHPRPLVPRRGLPRHVGGARRPGRAVRGRVLGVRAPARRARGGRPDRRAEAPERSCARSSPGSRAALVPERPSRSSTSKRRWRSSPTNRPLRNSLELKRTAMSRLGKQVVDLVDVTERFGDRTVIDDVTWLIGPGDRFGILGENGSGKTTLLNLIRGSLEPTSGHVKIGKSVKFAVLSQHLDELNELGDSRVREVLSRYKTRYEIDGKELTPAQLLGAPRVRGRAAVHARVRPVRRAEAPPPADAHPAGQAQRADPGRAGQRPGHRHARASSRASWTRGPARCCSSPTTAT